MNLHHRKRKSGVIIGINTLCIDCITIVDRFPKEGQAVRGLSQIRYPGGKGPNAILAAHKAGASTKFYSTVHPDDAQFLIKNLQESGIDISCIKLSEKTQTVIANITQHTETGDHTVVTLNGHHEITADMISNTEFTPDNTLMLQAKLPEETLSKLINLAYQNDCAITMNMAPVKKLDKSLISKLDLLVINEHEALDILNIYKISNNKRNEDSAQDIASYFGVITVLTRGAKGVILAKPDEPVKIYPAIRIKKVASTLGAGDAFFGVLTARLHLGDELDSAIQKSIAASAIVCTKLEPQSCPDIDEIMILLSSVS